MHPVPRFGGPGAALVEVTLNPMVGAIPGRWGDCLKRRRRRPCQSRQQQKRHQAGGKEKAGTGRAGFQFAHFEIASDSEPRPILAESGVPGHTNTSSFAPEEESRQ
jgi:hypothetical protein